MGGRRVATPRGEATRPTSDRVREAVFSALEATLGSFSGRAFLDLYAGSGAVGLEALSRGSARATLVEHDRRIARVIHNNVRGLGLVGAEVVTMSVERFLRDGPGTRPRYDAVFIDPPYSMGAEPLMAALDHLVVQGWLTADSTLVVERSSRTPEPHWPAAVVPTRSRRYGDTTVWYGRAV